MSKIQSSIQKAIEKERSRSVESGSPKKRRVPQKSVSDGINGDVAGERHDDYQIAYSDPQIMKNCRIVSMLDNPPASAAYNVLRTRILQRMRQNDWRTLIVTSPGSGEGKTLTASNLAISLSRDVNQSVYLVDLDLRRSSVAKYFGIEDDINAGVGDFLTGNAEIPGIVYLPSNMDRLRVIPNRGPVDNASDVLGGPRMKKLLAWLKKETGQSIVILDMPPVLAYDDVLALSTEIDSVLMVVSEGITERESLNKSLDLLQNSEYLGVVLNRSTDTRGNASYYY
jgi:capsular exopolysaccharide synthesis family protein